MLTLKKHLHIYLTNVTVVVLNDMLMLASIKDRFGFFCSTSDVGVCWVICQRHKVINNVYTTKTTWDLNLLSRDCFNKLRILIKHFQGHKFISLWLLPATLYK